MLLEVIPGKIPCVVQNTSLSSLTYNVGMLYQETGITLETWYELPLENQKISPLILSCGMKSFSPSMLMASNKHECLCEPDILTTGIFFSSIQTNLTKES